MNITKENKNALTKMESVLSKNEVNIFGTAKDFSSSDFWYYTSVSTMNEILKKEQIWVNSFGRMNDLNEAQLHSDVKSDVFALCFCNTRSEKIPMWYLYSGICGKGIRMGLTPANMLSFIRSIDKIYPIDESNNVSDEPIFIRQDFSIDCGWIFYRKDDGSIKFKGDWYNVEDIKAFEKDNYFVKDYPWEYEKEFRIIFKNNTGNDIGRIAIDVPPKIIKGLKLSYAPEVNLKEDIISLEGFQKYQMNNIKRSALAIKMNLISKNRKDIIENLKSYNDENTAKELCEAICSTNLCKRNKKEN